MAPKDKKGQEKGLARVESAPQVLAQDANEESRSAKGHKKEKISFGLKLAYLIFASLTALGSLLSVLLLIMLAVVLQVYSAHTQGGQVAGLSLLIVAILAAFAILIYSMVTLLRKQKKQLTVCLIWIGGLIVVQAIISATVLITTEASQDKFVASLMESFVRARGFDVKASRDWSKIQSTAKCCGFYGPGDYKGLSPATGYFPPDVPISCCPSYDPSRPGYTQEAERATCKARRTYYDGGCKTPAVETVSASTHIVAILVVLFLIAECITVLAMLAVVHSGISLMMFTLTAGEQESISEALLEVFVKSRGQDLKVQQQWSILEHELQCCGFNGPTDYKKSQALFVPDVPISCCPTYDPNRSPLVQERERAICKSRIEYYVEGCHKSVVTFLVGLNTPMLVFSFVYIAFEVLTIILACIAASKMRKIKSGLHEEISEN